MSNPYGVPRAAKLKVAVTAKKIGSGGQTIEYPAGKKCKVQRSPVFGEYVIWFKKDEVAKIQAKEVPDTIEYTDGKPVDWQ